MNNLVHIIFPLFEIYLKGKFLEVGLLGQRENTHVLLLDIATFPSMYHFAFPPAICESASFFHSLRNRVYMLSKVSKAEHTLIKLVRTDFS